MVAYSFQKRFVSHVQAGLERGPWLPGMKRHTLRRHRNGRGRHAAPEQVLQLYTAMRTKHCRLIGRAVCRASFHVQLLWDCGELSIRRAPGSAAPRSYVRQLAPIVQRMIDEPSGKHFVGDDMDEFARTDGFQDREEMARYFEAPDPSETAWFPMVLIAWAPGEPL
jgi:hypothetical protein